MSATPITPSARYYRQGRTRVLWTPTIADILSPTRSEINAATDLSGEIAASSGWEVTGNTEDTPDLGSVFVGNIPSTTTSDASSLTFYSDETSVDVRTLLQRGVVGNIIWMDEGDVEGYLMDIFPVRVTSAPKQRDIAAVAQIMVNFAISRQPAENVAIPA
ncbi:hypothetical protein RVR_5826 [Actinacidiphila reveromycinica]|uniref:Uncharacterized protein n=1 Tax=Actinacidiphila reveromycinica TaxID=659352 RepID=A0A7U3VQ30_9ACTN|nr:hypothetical protein [Streptomyces sp. SN-593]BBA99279.1 hypothetical protein RVR_5826 [Streptomyces sp. SN-593]